MAKAYFMWLIVILKMGVIRCVCMDYCIFLDIYIYIYISRNIYIYIYIYIYIHTSLGWFEWEHVPMQVSTCNVHPLCVGK